MLQRDPSIDESRDARQAGVRAAAVIAAERQHVVAACAAILRGATAPGPLQHRAVARPSAKAAAGR